MFLLEQTLESVEIADSNAQKKMTSLRKAIALVISDIQKLMFEYKELLKSYTEESSFNMETAAIFHNIHDVVKKVSQQLKPFSEITEDKSSKDRWEVMMNELKEQTVGKIKNQIDRVATLAASVPFHDSVNEVLYVAQLVRPIKRVSVVHAIILHILCTDIAIHSYSLLQGMKTKVLSFQISIHHKQLVLVACHLHHHEL